MPDLAELVREYVELLDAERLIDDRKQVLRQEILTELTNHRVISSQTDAGTAIRQSRFTLRPKRDLVLGLLSSDDLFPFAQFTPTKVKSILVPRYGRERLLPLFDYHKTEYLLVKRPGRTDSPRSL